MISKDRQAEIPRGMFGLNRWSPSGFIVALLLTVILGFSSLGVAQTEDTDKKNSPRTELLVTEGECINSVSTVTGGGGGSLNPTPIPVQYDVSGFSGAFNTTVPIRVPSYHGLEPSISLFYASKVQGRGRTEL